MELILQLIIISCLATGLSYAYHIQTGIGQSTNTMPMFSKEFLQSLEQKHLKSQNLDQNKNYQDSTNALYSLLNSYSTIGHPAATFNPFGQNFNHPIYNSPYASLFHQLKPIMDSYYDQSTGFLFTCDGLKTGFYSDIYNNCKYFHLCHQSPNFKFNPSNRLAITTYSCPESTFFNQKKQTCTRLDDFDTTCIDQIHMFKASKKMAEHKLDDAKNKQSNDIINESVYNKLIEAKNKNEKLLNEFANRLGIENSQFNSTKTTTISSITNSNFDNIANENYTETNNRNETDKSNVDKKDESNDLIEITFNCEGRPHGYYVDTLHQCKIFHVCQLFNLNEEKTHFMNSFRCPYDLVFNQATLTCTNEKDLIVPCQLQEVFFNNLQPNNQLLPEPIPEVTDKDEISTDSPISQ